MKVILSIVILSCLFLACDDEEARRKKRETERKRIEKENKEKIAKKKKSDEVLFSNFLKLAVERNLEYFSINPYKCSYSSTIQTNIFSIPVNKELIDAAVELKCLRESIADTAKNSLLRRNYNNFLNSGRMAFVLIVKNNSLRNDESVYFDNFEQNTRLELENGDTIKLSDYTRSFNKPIIPGLNSGFIYFNGTIPNHINSYNLTVANIIQNCPENRRNVPVYFTCETTGVDILKMLQEGMSDTEIRSKYNFKPHEESGINMEEFNTITSIIANLITIAGVI